MDRTKEEIRGSKILVVDDEPVNVELLEAYLSTAEYEVVTAYGGEEALEKVEREKPDLILLDVMMPRLNGFEVCKILKEKEETRFLPVIMVTALKELEDKIKGVESGADDFLTKPVNSLELLTRVKSLIRIKYQHDELERLVKELEARNAELEQFAYTVSHDLRSPLITVRGFAEILRDDLERKGKEEEEKDLEYLEYIETAAAKMNRLLNDTLQLSRIGRFVNPPEDVSFGELVRDALRLIAGELESSGVEVSVSEDFPGVHVDRMRIVELLVNLIGNSIKYRGEQPHPKIEIGYRRNDGETTFFVKDNGVGIAQSQRDKVFGLFYQMNKDNKGTGAGLAIVRKIVEAHEGRIGIKSEEGEGCTVYFTLPVVKR